MRNDNWLLSRLDYIWSNYFSDIPQVNPVFIRFGRFARLRFGSIRLDKKTNKTYIIISGMFKDDKVPKEVIDHTIAHELCHYTHGFSSPYKRLHKFPHEGGVIKKEIENRGLIDLYKEYRKWIRGYREELKEFYNNRRRRGRVW